MPRSALPSSSAAPVRRHRRGSATVLALTGLAVVAGALIDADVANAQPVATPAHADTAAVAFALSETVDHSTESYTFTTDSALLCPTGVFTDHVVAAKANADGSKQRWTVATTYTCSDGSGTFTAVKRLRRFVQADGAANIGPVRFTGGTGAYTQLRGHGIDFGVRVGQVGHGIIRGHLSEALSAGNDEDVSGDAQ